MPTDLEDRLRESLQARAADVQPDPATWTKVSQRLRRGQILRWTFAGVAVATFAALAVLATSNLLARRNVEFEPTQQLPPAPPTGAATPTAQPTPEPTTPAPQSPGLIANRTADGYRFVLRAIRGSGGNGAPPATVELTVSDVSGAEPDVVGRRTVGSPGGFFWNVLTGPDAVCRFDVGTTPAGAPLASVQLRLSQSLGCSEVYEIEFDAPAALPEPPASQDGLPAAVAEARGAIHDAAAAGDIDRLVELAGDSLATSFGGPEELRAVLEEREASGELDRLVTLLESDYGIREGGDPAIYTWPRQDAIPAQEWTAADEEALRALGYSDEEIAGFRQFGAYAGWRVGIDATGDWLYYTAGD